MSNFRIRANVIDREGQHLTVCVPVDNAIVSSDGIVIIGEDLFYEFADKTQSFANYCATIYSKNI